MRAVPSKRGLPDGRRMSQYPHGVRQLVHRTRAAKATLLDADQPYGPSRRQVSCAITGRRK